MFSMGKIGRESKREVIPILTAMSLVGGFITTMYYMTYYSYRFLTDPDTDLSLA